MYTEAQIMDAIDFLLDGLLTDGAHHKQWYIEQALLALNIDLKTIAAELALGDCAWEPGIAP